MKIESITFTLLTVGNADPVAKGCLRIKSKEEQVYFSLHWDTRPELRLELPSEFHENYRPTVNELNLLQTDILREYECIMRRALYGLHGSVPSSVLSTNLKVLRLGCDFTCESVARRLDVQKSTISNMENKIFDFEADIYKYVNPFDSLLFRAAAVYHVPQNAVWELYSPLFFLRNRIRCCRYDFGSRPLCKKLYPFRRSSLPT